MQLVERDDVDLMVAQMRQHLAQELGRDFEMTVRLEFCRAAGPHMMQRVDRAHAGENRAQPDMRAAEIQRFQAGANKTFAKSPHLK